jgi:hypothetical protein
VPLLNPLPQGFIVAPTEGSTPTPITYTTNLSAVVTATGGAGGQGGSGNFINEGSDGTNGLSTSVTSLTCTVTPFDTSGAEVGSPQSVAFSVSLNATGGSGGDGGTFDTIGGAGGAGTTLSTTVSQSVSGTTYAISSGLFLKVDKCTIGVVAGFGGFGGLGGAGFSPGADGSDGAAGSYSAVITPAASISFKLGSKSYTGGHTGSDITAT